MPGHFSFRAGSFRKLSKMASKSAVPGRNGGKPPFPSPIIAKDRHESQRKVRQGCEKAGPSPLPPPPSSRWELRAGGSARPGGRCGGCARRHWPAIRGARRLCRLPGAARLDPGELAPPSARSRPPRPPAVDALVSPPPCALHCCADTRAAILEVRTGPHRRQRIPPPPRQWRLRLPPPRPGLEAREVGSLVMEGEAQRAKAQSADASWHQKPGEAFQRARRTAVRSSPDSGNNLPPR